MIDRETIMTWLKKCGNGGCSSRCPYDDLGPDKCYETLMTDALELLKGDEQTIESLERTIDKLTKAIEEKPEQKFFVDSDGKVTPLPIQKHGHWVFDPDGMDWNIPAWKCSECHCRNDNIPPNLERTNPLRWSGSKFCPNCGAKMDEEVKQDG